MCEAQPAQIDCRVSDCEYYEGGGKCSNVSPAITLNPNKSFVCWIRKTDKTSVGEGRTGRKSDKTSPAGTTNVLDKLKQKRIEYLRKFYKIDEMKVPEHKKRFWKTILRKDEYLKAVEDVRKEIREIIKEQDILIEALDEVDDIREEVRARKMLVRIGGEPDAKSVE